MFFFLKRNLKVNKDGSKAEVLTPAPDNKVVLRGHALKHDDSWLFYVEVKVAAEGVNRRQHVEMTSRTLRLHGGDSGVQSASLLSESLPQQHMTFFMTRAEGETEQEQLLPIMDKYDTVYDPVYKTLLQQAQSKDLLEVLLLWHQRLGHRNFRDVAKQLGVPLPTTVPLCVTCVKGKSRRRPLTGSGQPLHDAPRPGYAFAWDHAGPFPVKTWGGNNTLSLKVDLHSGKLFPRMTNSTGACFEEWRSFVLKLEAQFGIRMMVARMLTDHAPYFEERRLQLFNEQRGIIHVQAPPYTQEFDGKVERDIGTVMGMVRCSMITARSPKAAYGECVTAMCYILDRTGQTRRQ